MKKRIFALLLGLCLLLPIFTVTAFADEATVTQYEKNQYVTVSGNVTFSDNPYVYTSDAGNTFLCCTISDGTTTWYAAIYDVQYSYFKATFAKHSLTLDGLYAGTATDGTNIFTVSALVEGDKYTNVDEYLFDIHKGSTKNPNFYAYADLLDPTRWDMSVAEDGSYLAVDSNPLNVDHGSSGLKDVQKVNEALGLPDWVWQEMLSTRAIDGRQKEVLDYVTVSWTYHPKKGLEVTYRKNA